MCITNAFVLLLYSLIRQGIFKGTKETFKNLEKLLIYFKLIKINLLASESIKAKV